MKCCNCKSVLVPLDGPAQPFVRVYGYARRVPLMDYDRAAHGGGETVAERQGWTREETDRAGIPPTALAPSVSMLVRDGTLRIIEHPIVCAKMECVTSALLALEDQDSGWYRDDRTFTEETGSMMMRASE